MNDCAYPATTAPCLKQINDLFVRRNTITKLFSALTVTGIYIFSLVYMQRRKARRNILWCITVILLCSNVASALNNVVLWYLYLDCDSSTLIRPLTRGYICGLGLQIALFNLAIWLLVYKYWEVSWVYPL